ncbi:xyloglucan endotransglucosylase/hydrolase protein 2-like [Henckelia pumila]|uniref:xyloglucan endotransglucosylase/hydrolase protein 2-like n=1 Tax=Henckelia pumila TaxID=405737 RepID=UPI003C6EA1BC
MGYYFMNINNSCSNNIPVLSSILLFILCLYNPLAISVDDTVRFDANYSPTWGRDHVTVVGDGTQVQLSLDERSGAGFHSNQKYGSGIFRMKLKLPNKKDKGIITTFYLTGLPAGQPTGGPHDEADFEFLGSNGKKFIVSTNVFANDNGDREQQFTLWFDPTLDFHVYEILWNQHHIVFSVDGIPIRVYHNFKAQIGANYPSQQMHVESSIWNMTDWLGPVDWSQGPFVAEYRGFGLDACVHQPSDPQDCHSSKYYWNDPKYWQLTPQQNKLLKYVRRNHLVYDYCGDRKKHFIECKIH